MSVVRCVECGFLALRNRHTLEIVGADEKYRRRGEIAANHLGHIYQEAPICCEGKADFSPFENDRLGAHALAKSERTCSSYMEWRPGLSPEGHSEMKLLAEVDRRNREQREEDLRWQKRVEDHAETRHRDNRRDFRRYLILTAIMAGASLIVALLAFFRG